MSDSAKELPPLPDKEPLVEDNLDREMAPIVKHADMAMSAATSPGRKRISLTMFPQRIENASHTSLIFILLAVFGFACGVAGMILMLQ